MYMVLECYDLLQRIEHHPAMWVGETSLKSIHNYTSGYYQALLDNRLINKTETNDPFFDWVAKKLDYSSSTAGWANMILAYSMEFETKSISWEIMLKTPVTEEQHIKSIATFYELLRQFKNETENTKTTSNSV
ncbi:hypothetical protein ACQ33O_10205 [Ferruginibacter sp. SUN002]|uniref:hypothetical protein n=1 Tax=Ferruginibacter sp. SUN002 TaxID=2937789 RepID=UPI003D36738C